MARTGIPYAVEHPVVVSGTTVAVPVVGASVSITKRSDSSAVTIFSTETGAGVLSGVVTDANGNIPGWVNEGAYNLTISGGSPNVSPVTVPFDAVRGDGVSNIAPGAVGNTQLQAGAAAANLGAAGGDLVGTFPNPTLAVDRLRIPTVSQPARSLNTVYRPSLTRPTLVIAVVSAATGSTANSTAYAYLQSDSSNPPTTVISQFGEQNISFAQQLSGTLTGLVLPGNYYQISFNAQGGSGFVNISEVTEYAL